MSADLLQALAQQRDPSHTLDVIRIPNPAAGADWSHTFTGTFVRRIIAVSGTLTTSAVVANRAVALNINAPEGLVVTEQLPAVVTAGLAVVTCWADGISGDAATLVNGRLTAGFGEYVLPAGYTIGTATGAIDVGDQWSNVLVWVESRMTQPWTTHAERLNDWLSGLVAEALSAQEG